MAVESSSTRIEKLLSASRAIYIIDETGILLHHEFFLGQDADPDLYSGLFTAVNVYAKELNAGKINAIKIKDYKFVFKEHDPSGYLIVMEVAKDMSIDDGKWLLSQILNRFEDIQKLMKSDFQGSLTLESLFDDRGKEIEWSTIHSIREDAIADQQRQFDHVETLNRTRINLNNRAWVKIRKIANTLVENQKGLAGLYLIILKNDHNNVLYSGRAEEKLNAVEKYLEKKVEGGVGLELETERVKIKNLFCAIYPLLCADGGVLSIASEDKYLISRLNNQMERLVASIEKIGVS